MKLIIEYDPWVDRRNAVRAADALKTLGIPAELREVRFTPRRDGSDGPVKFDPADDPPEGQS